LAWIVLPVVVLVLGFGVVVAEAGDGWWGGLDEGEAVSLADVIRGPRAYRDRTITFFCVFHTADGAFKYYPPNTPFSEQRHLNFSAWPDGAPVWEEATFKSDLPFLYLRRANSQRAALVRLPAYTRIEITGKVRDLVRGKPAIEVFSFRPTGHRLGARVVKNIIRGNANARAGSTLGNQLAAREFKAALQPDLPPVYVLIVRKLLADTLRRLGFPDEAGQYERGESVGLPKLASPPAGAPSVPVGMPGDMPQPFGRDMTGPRTPTPAARPPAPLGPPPTGAAPLPFGDPDGGAPAVAPRAAPPRSELPAMPSAPQGFGDGPIRSRPIRPRPIRPRPTGVRPTPTRPAAPGGAGRLPPPAPSYRDTPPPVQRPPSTPSAAAKSGIPPKRRSRLSGVK